MLAKGDWPNIVGSDGWKIGRKRSDDLKIVSLIN